MCPPTVCHRASLCGIKDGTQGSVGVGQALCQLSYIALACLLGSYKPRQGVHFHCAWCSEAVTISLTLQDPRASGEVTEAETEEAKDVPRSCYQDY